MKNIIFTVVAFMIIFNTFAGSIACDSEHSHENHIDRNIENTNYKTEINSDHGKDDSDSDNNDCITCSCLCNQKTAFYNILIKFSFDNEEVSRFFVETFLKTHFLQLPERPPKIC